MKPITGQRHILRSAGNVQQGEDLAELSGLLCADSTCAAGTEKPLQPFVPEPQDHVRHL
jgi:hypothetical protein